MIDGPGTSTARAHHQPALLMPLPRSPVPPAGAHQHGDSHSRAARADLRLVRAGRAERLAGLRQRIERGVYYIPDTLLARLLLEAGITL